MGSACSDCFMTPPRVGCLPPAPSGMRRFASHHGGAVTDAEIWPTLAARLKRSISAHAGLGRMASPDRTVFIHPDRLTGALNEALTWLELTTAVRCDAAWPPRDFCPAWIPRTVATRLLGCRHLPSSCNPSGCVSRETLRSGSQSIWRTRVIWRDPLNFAPGPRPLTKLG